jgi:hypothetical protein
MPDPVKFDHARAATAARTARQNERQPGGTLFVEMADLLEAAVAEKNVAIAQKRDYDISTQNLNRQLNDEKEAYRILRESSANYEQCVAVLKEIAGGAKGAKTKAQAMLDIINPPAPAAPQTIA